MSWTGHVPELEEEEMSTDLMEDFKEREDFETLDAECWTILSDMNGS
jgi:hypothetical protein